MKAVDRMRRLRCRTTIRFGERTASLSRDDVRFSNHDILTRLRTSSLRKARPATGSADCASPETIARLRGALQAARIRGGRPQTGKDDSPSRAAGAATWNEIPPYDTLTHGLALTPDERELYVTSMAGKAFMLFRFPS